MYAYIRISVLSYMTLKFREPSPLAVSTPRLPSSRLLSARHASLSRPIVNSHRHNGDCDGATNILSSSLVTMDAVVQFIRNALCCCKDLSIFEGTLLHDAGITRGLIGDLVPHPMDKTTPLEVIISITQFYACISCSRSGYTLLTSSLGKLRRIVRLVESRLSTSSQDWSHADRIVNESLIQQAKSSLRSAFVGSLVLPIGVSFFWLTCNSWHVTETNWIGGVPALIYALIVMELALVPLLFFMIADGFEKLATSTRCKGLLEVIESGKLSLENISIEGYQNMTGWSPFWYTDVSLFQPANQDEGKRLQDEIKTVKGNLDVWFPQGSSKGEKEVKLSKQGLTDSMDKLSGDVSTLRLEGYREFLYFVFNFVAFYGYLMAPLAFFYDEEEKQPFHIQSMKFFYDNDYADWVGNFAGDLMWTIEPLVILSSPFLIQMARPKSLGKVKSD